MFRVKIRRPANRALLAVGTGATWEEAAFDGYDQFVRRTGGARRYLAQVENDLTPLRKLVRFGYRTRSQGVATDPPVDLDIERVP
jgi:hypothetical protein